jgi:hypothetical protein
VNYTSSTLDPPLPPEVLALARRCGVEGASSDASSVVFRQTGSMRADSAHEWAPFHAKQSMALDRPGFVWRARTGPFGIVTVTDALEKEGGRLTVKAFGVLPLVHVSANAALTKGELLRYLAELPLAPDAILRNRALAWEVVSDTLLAVSASHSGVRARMELTLGPDGLTASAFAPNRPRLVGGKTVEAPWRGEFKDYRTYEGRRLPFAAEAAWTVNGVVLPVWRGEMQRWELA